jgi:hypothetical protein
MPARITEFITHLLLAVGAIALFYAGLKQILAKEPASATAAMSFGFLLIVMLTLSQFKHVKGFGFEAETWDQKQIEAAKLVEQLKTLTQATSRQLAIISARIGLWDNGFSNPELADLLGTTDEVLAKAEIEPERRKDILTPIYDRIEFNYISAGFQIVERAYKAQRETLNAKIRELGLDNNPALEKLRNLDQEHDQFGKLKSDIYNKTIRSLDPIEAFVTRSKALDGANNILTEIHGLVDDLKFFHANHYLQRKIDFDYLYR